MYKDNKKKKKKSTLGKIWYFIWEDDSILSWLVNIVLAFILIKFIVYPGLGFLFGTSHPVVAVVSGSMEHKITLENGNTLNYKMCGNVYEDKMAVDFDFYWNECGDFYREYNINKLQFREFPFHNGFNTGDIMVLSGNDPKNIDVGDVIVFRGNQADPIIHRVIDKWQDQGTYHFQTKGDHNAVSIDNPEVFETDIHEERVIGEAIFRIPFLGNIKIWFVEFLKLLGLNNTVGRLF